MSVRSSRAEGRPGVAISFIGRASGGTRVRGIICLLFAAMWPVEELGLCPSIGHARRVLGCFPLRVPPIPATHAPKHRRFLEPCEFGPHRETLRAPRATAQRLARLFSQIQSRALVRVD